MDNNIPINRSSQFLDDFKKLAATGDKNNQKVMQLTRDGNIIFAEVYGKKIKVIAETLKKLLRIDIYDRFKISNKNRQELAAREFFKALQSEYGYEDEQLRPLHFASNLKIEDVTSHLRRADAITLKKQPEQNFSWLKTTVSETSALLSAHAGIGDFQNLERPQRNALKAVIDIWKASTDKTNLPMDADKELATMISDSRGLLEAVVKDPGVAYRYRDECAKLGGKTADFFRTSTGESNYSNTCSLAFTLMREYSKFADWLTAINALVKPGPGQPLLSGCALAPALNAAAIVKGDDAVRTNLAAGKGSELQALLVATQQYMEPLETFDNPVEGLISPATTFDPMFENYVSLAPIRVCMQSSGIGNATAFSTSLANGAISPNGAMQEWAISVEEAVDKHGSRQEQAQKIGAEKFYNLDSISTNADAKLSFEHCTGIVWDNLNSDEKTVAANLCQQFARLAEIGGEHIETRLIRTKGLIAKLVSDLQIARQFEKTIKNTSSSLEQVLSELITKPSSDPIKMREQTIRLAMTYTKNVSIPLLKFRQKMEPKPNLEDLTSLVIGNTMMRMSHGDLVKVGNAALSGDSNITSLLLLADVSRRNPDLQLMPAAEQLNVDKPTHEEAFQFNMLRSFARKAVVNSPAGEANVQQAVRENFPDHRWLSLMPKSDRKSDNQFAKRVAAVKLPEHMHEINESIANLLLTSTV